jgi:hypothetical protein
MNSLGLHQPITEQSADRSRREGIQQVAGLWLLAALPVALLAWFALPGIIPFVKIPPVLLFWFVILAGLSWQFALSLWVIRREGGQFTWAGLKERLWLNLPSNPPDGQVRSRLLWRAVPAILLVAFIFGAGVIILTFKAFLGHLIAWMTLERLGGISSYALVSDLASPEFANQDWMIGLAIFTWLALIFGHELFFRGILLPKMEALSIRLDWVWNAALSGLLFLVQPLLVPFEFLASLIIARLTWRYRSFWMAAMLRSVEGAGLLFIVLLGVKSAPFPPVTLPVPPAYIARTPLPGRYPLGGAAKTEIPRYDLGSIAPFQVDLRSSDLSNIDLRGQADNLSYSDFDSQTVWPGSDRMPAGFDPDLVMETGKNPGLGLRSLHTRGIDGRGVGLAIIDQILLTNHQEYASRLKWYEEIGLSAAQLASMHGAAVSSLAVGQTVGVAPSADLYYLGVNDFSLLYYNSHIYAAGIRRILQINQGLPPDRKIRVISISSGWRADLPGYYDALAAVEEARQAGVFVVSSSLEDSFGFRFQGLGRSPTADPDQFSSYRPGHFWASNFYNRPEFYADTLLAPMDSRSMANMTGSEDYMFNRDGGISWTIPYIAGVYALAVQVDPTITPEQFWVTALAEAREVTFEENGQTFTLRHVIDPPAIMHALQR